MLPYILNIALMIVIGAILLSGKESEKNIKPYCIIASLQWILLIGLRHFTVGGIDVYVSYYTTFKRVANSQWSMILAELTEIFSFSGAEPGYLIYEKVISMITGEYQVLLFSVGLAFMIPLGIFIYKNSSDPILSFVLYSCLFYSFFSITGFRQTIATALVVLIGFDFIKKRKFIPFLIIAFIAFTFHRSSICFIPFYFLGNMRLTRRNLMILFSSGALIILLWKVLFGPVILFLGYENIFLSNTKNAVPRFIFFMIAFLVIALWRMKPILKNNENASFFYVAMICAIFITVLTIQNHAFMRIQQYYSIFMILLYPEIVNSFKEKNERTLVAVYSIEILLLFLVLNNPQYLFFWQ